MKSIFKIAIAVFSLSMCFAFTSNKTDGLNATYGVSEDDPSMIELQLNEDFTFMYQDFSNSAAKTQIQGTYQIRNNKIHLNGKDEAIEFHDLWKIAEDGKTAKSRKGLTFYTLRRK
jgi:hypothetical protein